jgi:YidC/Oxa1 family membrane protein insertase
MEKRLLLAFVLSAAILLAWSVVFPPPERQPPAGSGAAPTEAVPAEKPALATGDETSSAVTSEMPAATAEMPAAPPTDEVIIALAEQEVELSNEEIVVVLTNRGAAVSSYRLLGYDNDEGQPLELVQTVPLPEAARPLQLITAEGIDETLYEVEGTADSVVFRWSDGHGNAVTKRISLSRGGYGLDVEIETSGNMVGAPMSIGTGMRDLSERERDSRLALWGEGIVLADGELTRYKRGKIKEERLLTPQSLNYAGFEDGYFLDVFRPRGGTLEVIIEPFEYGIGEDETMRVLRLAVVPAGGELQGQLLGVPKEYDLLHEIGDGVEKTLTFGWFLTPIAVFFLKVLRWIYGVVGNWGFAIILLTLGIRIVLFPLMHTSTVSMRKMAKVQPKVKEIQAKYKKKKTDPQGKAKMNQEMMALYKQEGVNPMAGCLPMLVQMPLLFALYQLFLKAIELRHAPFMLWITDLSAKDPYYVTPILMTATMWLQQRLAPQAGDPQQQRLMRMMPLIFGIMFLQFPSGLVLYWLTNNIITIIQQEITLHMVGERKRGGGKQKKDGKK